MVVFPGTEPGSVTALVSDTELVPVDAGIISDAANVLVKEAGVVKGEGDV